MAIKIVEALNLAPADREVFMRSLVLKKKKQSLQRMPTIFRNFKVKRLHVEPEELSHELYQAISEWYHAVILELPYVEEFVSEPRWIAKQLGISITEATIAVERLVGLRLIERENGKIKVTGRQFTSADKHLTSLAHKKNQKQFLERAIFSLENDPIERRNNTRMTMAIDPGKIPLAKEMLLRFSRRLCRVLESGKRTQVYTLCLALFPNQILGANKK